LSKHQATAAAEKKLQAKASIPALRNEKGEGINFQYIVALRANTLSQGDDSKTVHQNVLSALQELEALNQNSPPTPSKVEPTSSSEMKTAEDLEADHRRIFLMNKVIDILKRNVRVRYELKVLDLFRMYVIRPPWVVQ
jgi:rapamycin-insensitive companion of mTOR